MTDLERSDDEPISEYAAATFFERLGAHERHADLRWHHVREGALAAGFTCSKPPCVANSRHPSLPPEQHP